MLVEKSLLPHFTQVILQLLVTAGITIGGPAASDPAVPALPGRTERVAWAGPETRPARIIGTSPD
jgi:hypothetical protein